MKIEEILVENLKNIKEIFNKYNIQSWLDWGTLLGAVRNGKIIEWDHDIDLGVMECDFKKINLIISEIEKKGFFIIKSPISTPELTFRKKGYGIDIWKYSTKSNNLFVTSYYELSENKIAQILWFLWRILGEEYSKVDLPKKGYKFILTYFIKCIFFLFPPKLNLFLKKIFKKILIKKNYIINKQASVPNHYFEKFKNIKFYGMTFNIPFDSESYLKYKYGKSWKVPIKEWHPFKEDGTIKFSKDL